MKLQQLRYFIAVYEAGSITAGAEKVNATQSGLSMQIKDLEIQFGAPLFDRFAYGITPTERGRRFYHRATRILHEVSETEQEMKMLKGELTGQVRAGLMPTFTRSILPPSLIHFSEQHPLVKTTVLEAYSAQLVKEVANEELDFAVVPAPAIGQEIGVNSFHMASDTEFLVSAATDKSSHLKPVDLTKEGPLKLVLPGPKNARRARIDAYLQTYGIEVECILELDAMLGTMELVAQSDWKTILPGILCFADRDGLVRNINPLAGAPLTVDYIMIEPNTQSLSPEARIFADILSDELNGQINWHQNI